MTTSRNVDDGAGHGTASTPGASASEHRDTVSSSSPSEDVREQGLSQDHAPPITAVTSGQSRKRDDLDRGFNFATMLDELIERFGPSDLTLVEHEAMVDHLLHAAIEWDKARNRAKAAVSKAEGQQ